MLGVMCGPNPAEGAAEGPGSGTAGEAAVGGVAAVGGEPAVGGERAGGEAAGGEAAGGESGAVADSCSDGSAKVLGRSVPK